MNRWYNQFFYSLEKGKTSLFARVSIGASGAPTLVIPNSKGVASIVRNSAGNYTITLQDIYVDLFNYVVKNISATAPTHFADYVSAQAVSTAKTIVVIFLDASGAPVDPASGEVLNFDFILKSSTAQ